MKKYCVQQIVLAVLLIMLGLCQFNAIDPHTRVVIQTGVSMTLLSFGLVYLLYRASLRLIDFFKSQPRFLKTIKAMFALLLLVEYTNCAQAFTGSTPTMVLVQCRVESKRLSIGQSVRPNADGTLQHVNSNQ